MWSPPRGFNLLASGIAFSLFVHILDIISSVIAMAYVPGAIEANALMRNPLTFAFLLGPAIKTKLVYLIFQPALLSLFLWLGSRSFFLASAPWFYYSLGGLGALASNFTMIVLYGIF